MLHFEWNNPYRTVLGGYSKTAIFTFPVHFLYCSYIDSTLIRYATQWVKPSTSVKKIGEFEINSQINITYLTEINEDI